LSSILANNGFRVLSIQSKEYLHHLFTSLQGYLRRHLKSVVRCEISMLIGDKLDTSNKNNNATTKEVLRRIVRNTPYSLGSLLYPLLRPYGIILEHCTMGHELIVFSKRQ
jgi:hypothetical protein